MLDLTRLYKLANKPNLHRLSSRPWNANVRTIIVIIIIGVVLVSVFKEAINQ